MIVLSLFGTTTGLEVQHFMPGKDASPIKIDNTWVEVSPNQVALRSDADCYLLQRRKQDGKTLTWVGLYRSAREIGYDRQGGFYGAGVWLIDITVDARTLLEVLANLANQVRDKALSGGKFIKRIADIRSEISMPPQLGALASTLGNLAGGGCSAAGSVAFVVTSAQAPEIIEWAQKSRTAELFSTVFVGSADQYVANKTEFQQIYKFNGLQEAIDAAYVKRVNDLSNHNQKLSKECEEAKDNLTQALLTEKDAKASFQQIEQQLLFAQRQNEELKRTQSFVQQPQLNKNAIQDGRKHAVGLDLSGTPGQGIIPVAAQPVSAGANKASGVVNGVSQKNPLPPEQLRAAPKSIFESIGGLFIFLAGLVLGLIICAVFWVVVLRDDVDRKVKPVNKNVSIESSALPTPSPNIESTPASKVCDSSKNTIVATVSVKDKSQSLKVIPEDIIDKIKYACRIAGPECSQEISGIKEKIGDKPFNSKDIELPENCGTELPINGNGFLIIKKETEKESPKKSDPKSKGAK